MKFTLTLLFHALVAFAFGLYLPWWSIALAGFIVGLLIPQSSAFAWLSGFSGIFLLWGLLAAWIDYRNLHILSSRLAVLFPLGGNGWALVLLTAVLGGIVGGTASMSGSLLRKWIRIN
jgi:hypothetical protein